MLRIPYYIPIFLVACCLFRAAPSAVAEEPKQDAFTAEQLLDRMAKAYANCKTYRDSGVAKTVIVPANGKGTTTLNKPFETAFVRPDRFRFECREQKGKGKENRYLISSKGKDVQTWNDAKPGIEKADSLIAAQGAAIKVAGRSAHTIPKMLMPKNDFKGKAPTIITEGKRSADVKLDNVDCFCVEGKLFVNEPATLWLDKKTFLVRRIDSQTTSGLGRVEMTTIYDPVIDGEITEKMLAFDPPK